MVTIERDAKAVFRTFNPHATSVEILGTFTGWHDHPVRMTKTTDGWWHAEIELTPGDHEFQYLIDRREWVADYAAGGLRMGKFGSWLSLLSVATPAVTKRSMPTLRAAA